MIVTIRSVRPSRRGFVVIWHLRGAAQDTRASVLEIGKLPRGHELLRAGVEVDLVLNADGRIVMVREVGW